MFRVVRDVKPINQLLTVAEAASRGRGDVLPGPEDLLCRR